MAERQKCFFGISFNDLAGTASAAETGRNGRNSTLDWRNGNVENVGNWPLASHVP
jgi:hypothetical protein